MTQRCLRIRRWVASVLLGFIWSAGLTVHSFADDSDLRTAAGPAQLVEEALHREVYGLQSDRDHLLVSALQRNPDYAPARWHQGFVSYRGNWKRAADIPQLLSKNAAFVEYGQRRLEFADDLDGNLSMANWCRRYHLTAQERAHLSRVLDFHQTTRSPGRGWDIV